MKNFTYWVAEHFSGTRVYNLRAKTKHEVNDLIITYGEGEYDKPKKVTIPYADIMDLVNWVAGAGFNE